MDFLFIQHLYLDTQRKVSEDANVLVSCGLSNLLHFYCISLSIPALSFSVPAILVSRALRSFPHTVGCYTLVLQQEEAILTLGRL